MKVCAVAGLDYEAANGRFWDGLMVLLVTLVV